MSAVLAAAPSDVESWGQTRRLALREFNADDLDELVRMHHEPRLRTHLVDDYPLHQREVAQLFLERMPQVYRRHEGLGIWHTTVLEPQPSFGGWFNLMPMAEQPGEVEIGARLLPLAWGGGLALEGGELMLEQAFERLGLDRVWGICHPNNRSARAVLAALGFVPLGLRPYDGGVARFHRIGLNEWRALRNTPPGTRMRQALRSLSPRDGAIPALSEDAST
jgi:RimJ/RimL family protein N-acetyltransferase